MTFQFRPKERAIFNSTAHGGLKNTSIIVIRRLRLDEADPEVGPMYKIRLPDGAMTDAFQDELTKE